MAASHDEFLARNQTPLDQAATRTRFQGAVAVVSGGASGIGLATVERFLNDGAAHVAIVDLNRDQAEWAMRELEKDHGARAHFVHADVTDAEALTSAVAAFAATAGGRIDHVVASAAYFGSHGLDGSDADYLASFRVNVLGTVHLVQAARPFMARGGSVVLLSSISAHRCQPQRWTYAATKGAVAVLTKDMALDLSSAGVRVNSVSPGWIWSPEQRRASPDGSRKAMRGQVGRCSFVGRDGDTGEVAAAIAFLSSRDAAFIDGADLPVDGGYQAMGPEGLGEKSVYAGHEESA